MPKIIFNKGSNRITIPMPICKLNGWGHGTVIMFQYNHLDGEVKLIEVTK